MTSLKKAHASLGLLRFLALSLTIGACGATEENSDSGGDLEASQQALIPERLAPFGEGYPSTGDPCSRLGESESTINYRSDSAILVGCPDCGLASAVQGSKVDVVEGITSPDPHSIHR